jgi:drug/metabolite transporter, DME family
MEALIGEALAVLSAATSAFSVVLVRKYSDSSSTFNISLAISLVGTLMLWPFVFLTTNFSAISIASLVLFALSGILTPGFVRLLYYQGMKKLGTPANSSLFAIYPLYTALLAVLLLSETLTMVNWVGIFIVFSGAVMVEWSSRSGAEEKAHSWRNLLLPVMGGVALAIGAVLRKYGLVLFDAPVLGVAVAYTASLFPFIVMFMLSTPTRRDLSLKRDLRLFWVAGVGQAVTWILSFYALSLEDVSVVTPLLSVEPVFVALFAFLYLRRVERINVQLVLSIVLTVAGIVLVTAKI